MLSKVLVLFSNHFVLSAYFSFDFSLFRTFESDTREYTRKVVKFSIFPEINQLKWVVVTKSLRNT